MRGFIVFFLLISVFFSSQIKEVKIVNIKNQPIDSVQVYINSKKSGYSNSNGFAKLSDVKKSDSIVLIKNDFQNYSLTFDEIDSVIRLDSIRTMDIEGVVLSKIPPKEILRKVFAETEKYSIYTFPRNRSLFSEFKTDNKVIFAINNKFFHRNGFFIENRNGVYKDFRVTDKHIGSKSQLNGIIRVANVKGEEFSIPVQPYRGVGARYMPQFINLMNNIDSYKLTAMKSDSLTIVDFAPIKNDKKELYAGRIIVDTSDYGIVEAVFNLLNNKANMISTSHKVNTKTNFQIDKEEFVIRYKKNNGKYHLVFTTYDLDLQATNGRIKGEKFYMKYQEKPVDELNLQTAIGIDIQTLEFK